MNDGREFHVVLRVSDPDSARPEHVYDYEAHLVGVSTVDEAINMALGYAHDEGLMTCAVESVRQVRVSGHD